MDSENTCVHWQTICHATLLGLTCKNPLRYEIPEAQELAMRRVSARVGVPTLLAAKMPTVDLHSVLWDWATTLPARMCETLRHSGHRAPVSSRIATIRYVINIVGGVGNGACQCHMSSSSLNLSY